jgi:hypothetical protein
MACLTWSGFSGAEEDETISVNGMIKLQSGVFVPLFSDLFSAQKNEAWILDDDDNRIEPCNPIMTPNKPCYPVNHGQEAGSLSMFRATLQLEGDWTPHEKVGVHALFRGVRSLEVDADGWAQLPRPSSSASVEQRKIYNRNWVRDNYYTEFDLREFYIDAYPTDWLSFRLGRQQVTWGETGQYRLLDVINPSDTTWHFGPLESFEDTRIPLWIAKSMVEFQDIDHALEVVWVPGIDRPQDMVNVPLTFVGAWGVPYTNTPSPFIVDEKVFMYPKNSIEDTMRIGFRWKGNLTQSMSYSLVYYYTHQMSPPIPMYYDLIRNPDGTLDSNHMETLYLGFPRQHIAGFTFDFSLENPIGAVVKLEAAIEPNRTYPQISTTTHKHVDPNKEERYHFENPKKMAISYAVQIMRPTMIRFLNPTQNFLLVLQFMHTIVPNMSEEDKHILVEIPGFNEFLVKPHTMRIVGVIATNYFHGFLTPKIIGAYILPDSGFITAQVGFRLGDSWRLNLAVTDFFGKDPYKGVGLLRDRDEINLSIMCQF